AGVLLALQSISSAAYAQSLDAFRDYEPVVIEASAFINWVNASNISAIALYKYTGTGFTAIPFQIDKRRKITLDWNLSALAQQSVCEYGYFREKFLPSGQPDVFADPVLKATDEVVFMLKDAGATRSDQLTSWHQKYFEAPPKVDGLRYEIILTDSCTGAQRFVYAFRWLPGYTPDDLSSVKYVKYTRDANPPDCMLCPPLEQQNCDSETNPPVSKACGTAESKGGANLPNQATLKSHFSGSWITDSFVVKQKGSDTPYCTGTPACDDMLERIHYYEDGFDEIDLSQGSSARVLGVTGDPPPSTTVEMPIRFNRCIQGARSGAHTTKCEFIYATRLHTRINLRVHEGVQHYKSWFNHELGIKLQDRDQSGKNAYIWTRTKFTGTPQTYLDHIDGQGPGYQEFVEPAPEDWTEVPSERRGTYVDFTSEPRRVPSADRTYTYKDVYSVSPSITDIGTHGRHHTGTNPNYGLGNTQDGDDHDGTAELGENDGGCPAGSDPESPLLNFARLETVFIPHDLRGDAARADDVVADDFALRQDSPVFTTFQQQTYPVPQPPPGPGEPPPCPPSFSSTNRGDGFLDHVLVRCPYTLVPVFHRIYRGLGSGPLTFYKDLKSALTWTDISSAPGQTYRYSARAYYAPGQEGGDSNINTVAVTDTTPPAIPMGLVGLAGNQLASLSWQANWTRDLWGYNVYRATVSGGPYTKLNSTPILAGAPRQYTATGLTNGQPYYFVIKGTDYYSNESGPTAEVLVTPQQ
ncbi:MAG: fibronectin type III domain-containing protein, partial [Candidatus Methylomirabilales bacterium]